MNRNRCCWGLFIGAMALGAAAQAQGVVPTEKGSGMAAKTAFVCSPFYRQHQVGPRHPEQPRRLDAIEDRLQEQGLTATLLLLRPSPAPLEWVTRIHSSDYVERVRRLCADGAPYIDTTDVPVSKESWDVARLAAGGVLAAVDAVAAGQARNAFCAVRPPGHHALRDRAMGFCILNNVAIASRYAQDHHKLGRVLIVDWDVHHGNGTQAAFNEDPTVFYFSTHQDPFYPGSGKETETGAGAGLGATLNVPLPAGSGEDSYRLAFTERLVPAALAFKPDIVFISAGFDAHRDDPLGRMDLTAESYAVLTRVVKDVATRGCAGRLIAVLEGGYDLDGLADSVAAVIRVLQEP